MNFIESANADVAAESLQIDGGWPDAPPRFAPIAIPDRLFIPIAGGGATSLPRRVDAGERLSDDVAEGMCFPLSPFPGVATATSPVTLFDGTAAAALELQTAVGEPAPKSHLPANEARPDRLGQWIDILREHGISANRRTSPDCIAQCYAALARPIDTVLLNLLDVDPTIPLNAALAATHPRDIRAGAELIARLTGATRIWAGIDQHTPDAWSSTFCQSDHGKSECKLIPLVNDYPQSDPSLLIYALLNRRLRPGHLPVEQGVIVIDAAAALAVGRVALYGEAMLTVPIAVRDHAGRRSHFRTVPIGTPIESLLKALKLPAARWLKLRGGDVLRDITISPDAVASGSELIVHAGLLEPPINPDPCVRCGWCFESCPTLVQPANCLEAAQRDDLDLAERFGINGCIECGICSYVCPSHLPILAGIRQLRKR